MARQRKHSDDPHAVESHLDEEQSGVATMEHGGETIAPRVGGGSVRQGQPSKRPDSGAITKLTAAATGPVSFEVIDNHAAGVKIMGLDANGNRVELSEFATLVITSSDATIITADRPNLTSFKLIALKPGTANLTVVLTYKNGLAGPFTFTIPVIVTGIAGVELWAALNGTITIA